MKTIRTYSALSFLHIAIYTYLQRLRAMSEILIIGVPVGKFNAFKDKADVYRYSTQGDGLLYDMDLAFLSRW